MDENQTPGAEAEVPATAAVETPVAVPAAEVPNVSAPVATASAPETGAVAAVGAEVAEVPTIAKSELAHVFEAFEHFSLMEGISRLYALAKKHL
jgi:hypothetical protein